MSPSVNNKGFNWKAAAVLYLGLLAVSHSWQAFTGNEIMVADPEKPSVRLQAVAGDTLVSGLRVRVPYRDLYTGVDPEPPVLLLLEGEEGALDSLLPYLDDSLRVVAPDLPGQGGAYQEAPDYSMSAWAVYAGQLLDSLEIDRAHVLGHELGGAAAIRFSRHDSSSTASLILLSSMGVQELEMLGSRPLNHAVHGIRLGTYWFLRNAVPHFGLLEKPLHAGPARTHFDSDQRPLRDYLRRYRGPMLIQHGEEDAVVPAVAAREHYRIVPQSRLEIYEGSDHKLVQNRGAEVARDILSFVRQVERDGGITASRADSTRLKESRRDFESVEFSRFTGFNLVLLMFFIAIATFISEDLTCIGAGLLAARGLIGFFPATAACFIGILVGDMGLYLVGRWLGRPAVKRAPLKWMVSESDLKRSAEWFSARGPAIIIASRFLPGSRLPTYFSAGVIGAGFWMFSFYFLIAAVIWTPLLVGLSMLVGQELIAYFSLYREYALWVVLGAVLLLLMIVKVVLPAFSYRGRRLLISRWKRLTNWEFWPPWVIYFPVFCYILWLSLRYRGLTVFTAANPGIPEGGFVGESKSGILDLFPDEEAVAPYRLISSDLERKERLETANRFMEKRELDFPVVVKPDRGERGSGVEIIRHRRELEDRITGSERDLMIQQYAGGDEFGVFYYRYPGMEQGNIFSITCKEMLLVEGDGVSTLEELILEDDRALCLAPRHLRVHRDRLYDIPEKGEQVPLVEIGTHAKGSVFSDGGELISENLRREMDRISRSADGFFFGRYDLRAPSREALKRGEGLRIIEVNGVTSESTNIYDASHSFLDAQRILMKQWRLAFKIGHIQAERGHKPAPTGRLLTLLFHHVLRRG